MAAASAQARTKAVTSHAVWEMSLNSALIFGSAVRIIAFSKEKSISTSISMPMIT